MNSSTSPAAPPPVAGHPAEQLRHLPVDRFLGGVEELRDLGVAEALGHHVEQLPLAFHRVASSRKPLGDRRIHAAPTRVDLADRARQLVALRDVVFQQVGQAAVAAAEEGERVRLVVVRGQDHHAGVGMSGTDRMRAVDPLQLERRRHLDVRDDHVGHLLGGGLQQRRRVGGDPYHFDVVVGVEQRPDALANQDVVLAQDHSDAHAALSVLSIPPCTIRA